MFEGNPLYTDIPAIPEGLESIRYGLGGALFGSQMRPYTPVNQSIIDAQIAARVNDPLFKSMMSGVYAQMGGQVGMQIGNTQFARDFAAKAGMSADQFKATMTNFGRGVGANPIGGMVLGMLDGLMAGSGFINGSYTQAAQTVFNNRMALLSPGSRLNVFDAAQQHQAMAGASAVMNMVNGLITPGGGLETDQLFTRGFDRNRIAQVALRMAGAGAFNVAGQGLTDRLSAAANGVDLTDLDSALGDFTGGGKKSILDNTTAEKVKKVHGEFKNALSAGLGAIGAMRDMLKEVDGLEEKLDALTGGDWARSESKARQARENVRRLDTVARMYNIDPKKAMQRMLQNQGILQEAAGFDENMRFFGFDGGGMFRLGAQTELLSTVEDAINARGIRNDPILAERFRRQGTQAIARNMNTQAGVAAQLLAYARQTGVVSDEAAKGYQRDLTSGDRGVMEDSINRLLVTTFGSKERGRQLMQDSMFVNSMRQSLSDDAGKFAMQTIVRGADSEMARRERITAAENRMAFSRSILLQSGISAVQTDDGVAKIVDSISGSLNGKGAGYGDAFRAEYERRIASGQKPNAALQATLSSIKKDPVIGKYAETVDLAYKTQVATNNEETYTALGPEGKQAFDTANVMRGAGFLTGEQYRSIADKVRGRDGKGALEEVNAVISGLDDASRIRFEGIRNEAGTKYRAALQTFEDKKEAADLVGRARELDFGSDAVVNAFDSVTTAIRDLASGRITKEEFGDAIEKSNVRTIFGKDFADKAIAVGEAGGDEAGKYAERLGRMSVNVRQVATETLRKNGWDLSMSGFWGGGAYSGNKEVLLADRDKAVKEYADAIDREEVKGASNRNTLAQDFMSMLEDNDWRKLLRLHDKDGGLSDLLGKDYFAKFDEYEKASARFASQAGAIRDGIRAARDSGKIDEANKLGEMLKDLGKYDDAAIEKQLEAAGIKDTDKGKSFMDAVREKRNVVTLGDIVKELGKEAIGKKGFSDKMTAYKANKEVAESLNKVKEARGKEASDYFDTLDLSDYAALAKGTLGDAYKEMWSVVSLDDIKAAKGVESLDGYKAETLSKEAFKVLQTKAASGDKKAIGVMDKFQAAAKEANAVKIKGSITLQNGGESMPAVLEGEIGKL